MTTSPLLYITAFVLLELFEVFWQKAPTLGGVVENIYRWYHKSVFLVFLLHPTLYLSIYLMIVSDYALSIEILFGLKLSDIALKLILVKRVFIDKQVSPEIALLLNSKVENYMLYAGVVVYPVLIYIAFM